MQCPPIALALLCLAALSSAVAKETAAGSTFKRFPVAGTPAPVYYHAAHRIEDGSLCETAAVMIHGWGGGFALGRAEGPFAAALANAAGPSNVAPYVIAPLFPRKRLLVKRGSRTTAGPSGTNPGAWTFPSMACRTTTGAAAAMPSA